MKLVQSVSHVDLTAAIRQMAWIGFLSSKNGNSMLNESVLMVVSRRASRYPKFKQLVWLAARIFGETRCYVPETEHERGWPAAANFMFKTSLEHVERHFPDDVFFLEPDGTPVTPDWFDVIQEEWVVAQSQGKNFMGAYVPHSPSHMTGIAVYGKDWRKYAPRCATTPDHDAFDTWAAPEIVPNCHFVKLIQHVFRRHAPGWSVPAIGILQPGAVLFHQDKTGKLIYLLDDAYYGGECRSHPLFGYATLTNDEIVMRKFYHAGNITRAIKAQGKRFDFQAIDILGGSVPGVFITDIEADQAALAELTADPTSGVSEVSQEEWERLAKKKAPKARNLSISQPLKGTLPQAALLPTPSNSPAVVVAEPLAGSSASEKGQGPIKDIAEVIKVAKVELAQLPNIGPRLPRPQKTKNYNINRETPA